MKMPSNKKNVYGIFNSEALALAANRLSGTEFKLYIYLAKNQDGYAMALSKRDFMDWANCQENTYRSAVAALINKGYLKLDKENSNKYTFLEKPEETDISMF